MPRPESVDAIVYGPVVIGYSVMISSSGFGLPSAPWPHLREKTGSAPILKIMSSVRSARSKRIVRSSMICAPFAPSYCARTAGAAPLLVSMSNECLTSAAVTGSPLLKRALGLIRIVIDDLSGGTSISSASTPYIVPGSSPERSASDSNIRMETPVGGLPFSVNGLNLSKLVRRSGLPR